MKKIKRIFSVTGMLAIFCVLLLSSCDYAEKASSSSQKSTPEANIMAQAYTRNGCEVAYTIVNDWGSGFVGEVTITNNNNSSITEWTVNWTYSGNQSIVNAWNVDLSQNGSQVTCKNLNYNGTIPSNGNLTFGFQGTYSGSNVEPSDITITTNISGDDDDDDDDGTVVDRYGQLKIVGTSLCNEDNQAIQLKGMSSFWLNWIGEYSNYQSISWLQQDWEITLFRASMGIDVEYGYLENPSGARQKVEEIVDACIELGIYVIIDWHAHENLAYKTQEQEFFSYMAQKYGDKPNVLYEIWNEPTSQSWDSAIKPYAEDIISTIRQYDPDNIILIGSSNWSQDVDKPASNPISGTNLMYTLHFYAGTHGQWLRDRADRALNTIPIFVSEWGTSAADGGSDGVVYLDASRTWIQWMEDRKISWANWSLCNKEESSAALQPNASTTGNWTSSDLTESGNFVREQIKN